MRNHPARGADLIHSRFEDARGCVIGVGDYDLALGLDGGGGEGEEGEEGWEESELHCWCGGG